MVVVTLVLRLIGLPVAARRLGRLRLLVVTVAAHDLAVAQGQRTGRGHVLHSAQRLTF